MASTSASASASASSTVTTEELFEAHRQPQVVFHGEIAGRLIRILDGTSGSYRATRLNVPRGPWEQALHRVCMNDDRTFPRAGILLVRDLFRPLVHDEVEYDALPVVIRNIAGTIVAFACGLIDCDMAALSNVRSPQNNFVDYGDRGETIGIETEVLAEVVVCLYRIDVVNATANRHLSSDLIEFSHASLWGIKDYIRTEFETPTDDVEELYEEYKALKMHLFEPHIISRPVRSVRKRRKRKKKPVKMRREWIKRPPKCMMELCVTKLEEDICMKEDTTYVYDTASHAYRLASLCKVCAPEDIAKQTVRLLPKADRSFLGEQFEGLNGSRYSAAMLHMTRRHQSSTEEPTDVCPMDTESL